MIYHFMLNKDFNKNTIVREIHQQLGCAATTDEL